MMSRVMLWLDSVEASPTIGIQFRAPYRLATRLPQVASVAFDEWPDIVRVLSADALKIAAEAPGLRVRVEPNNVIAEAFFDLKWEQHANTLLPKPGPQPEIKPFSEQLKFAIERISDVVRVMAEDTAFEIQRIGFIASAKLPDESLPPAYARMRTVLDGIVPGDALKCEFKHTTILSKSDLVTHRCHHHFSYDLSSDPMGYTAQMDWQCVFSKPHNVSDAGVATSIATIRDKAKLATDYFKKFAFDSQVAEAGLADGL